MLEDRPDGRVRRADERDGFNRDNGSNPNEIVVRVTGDDVRRGPAPTARRGFTVRGAVITALLGAVAVGLFLLVGAVVGLFSIGNPFDTTRVDRTQPALLKELSNLSDYHAAQGTFMVEVDVEDDVNIIPSFLAGERTIFRARGSVDSTVDFSKLSTDAVQTQDQSVTITLPEPAYATAIVDPVHSEVIDRDRGLFTRIGDMFSDDTNNERDLYRLAGKKLDAAAKESTLRDRAEKNTSLMLEGLLGRLGYTDVHVVFEKAPAAEAQPANK
jgi:hypothetical protein